MQNIFMTGGTGYIGNRLIKALDKESNYQIRALVRKGSEHKIPLSCEMIPGNALEAISYQHQIEPGSVFVHLLVVAHAPPSKKEAFKEIDFVSTLQAVNAANMRL